MVLIFFGYAKETKACASRETRDVYVRFSQFPRLDDIAGFLTF